MNAKARDYKNGWSTFMEKTRSFYHLNVRNARGDLVDKVRTQDYWDALAYWKSFNAIAKAGGN